MKKSYLYFSKSNLDFYSISLKFKNVSAKIDALIKSGKFWKLSKKEQNHQVRKLRRLFEKLYGFNPRYAFKIAGAAMCFVFITSKANAQIFTAWPDNPFSSLTGTYIDGAFADIDGDGDNDAILLTDSREPKYFENVGGVYTENPGANPFQSGERGTGIDIADFNNDGVLDAIIIDGHSSGHITHYRLQSGVFNDLSSDYLNYDDPYNQSSGSYKAKFNDVDGDGLLDIVIPLPVGAIKTLIQQPDHSFIEQLNFPVISVDFGYPAGGIYLNMADMDLDGDDDLFVFPDYDSSPIGYFENTSGSGVFVKNLTIPLPISQMSNPMFTLLVDLDGDGDIDVFTPNAPAATSNLRNGVPPAPGVPISTFFAVALFAAAGGYGIFRRKRKRNRS